MATSSILSNVKITDPKKIESFIKALDASAYDSKRAILTGEPPDDKYRRDTEIDVQEGSIK